MSTHLRRELEKLEKRILSLGALVEQNVREAVKSVQTKSIPLARRVMEADCQIDQAEVEIEEECLKLLTLYQPVANDLRFLVAVLKINNDLERIGDLAVNVAERAAFLARQDSTDWPFDFPGMAAKAQSMLKRSLDALVNTDAVLAREVCADDDEVDAINRQMYDQVKDAIRSHPQSLDALIHLLCVSRHIERIADLATNIAQDVVYMVKGEIIRHHVEDYNSAVSKPG